MPLPRFHLWSLMIAVPLAGVVLALAIRAAACIGSVREGLLLVLLLSVGWVPAVFVFLDPKVAGWLLMLAVSAWILSLAFSVYNAALGGLWLDTGICSCLVTFWLTFAFGIGYVATKALHLPDYHRGRDSQPGADSQADR
ncbi:MAG: hypothetical protein ACLP7Q_15740 [Isosphaeraceae bacterium]